MTEQEAKKRYPDPPTSWTKAPVEKPKRSWRGFWFGVLASLLLAILLPTLAYVVVLIYIKTGGVERAVNAAVKESLGPGASTGGVETSGIESLRINELTLPSSDGNATPTLQVKSVKVLWDPYALIRQKQVRAVEIEKPSLALRRDANGKWNYTLPPSKPSEYWVEQLQVTGGVLGLEWAPGRRVDLNGLRVLMTRAQPPLPQPVSIYAQWPSQAELHAEAVLGPGQALKLSLNGTLDLAQDVGSVGWPGEAPVGKLTYRFDTSREWSVYTGAAGDLTFDGRVDLKDFRWKFRDGLALVAPDRRIELRARVPAFELGSLPGVEDVVLDVGGLGSLHGRLGFPKASTPDGAVAVFEKGQLRVAVESLPKWFEGLNLLSGWRKEGELILTEATVSVPLERLDGLTYQTRLDLPALRLAIPGTGELPELKLQAQVSGSLKGAKISAGEVALGEIGRLAFDAEAGWSALDAAWLELLKVVNIRAFDLDAGALLRSEFGRRLLSGRLGKGEAPTLGELPVLAQGKLSARELKTAVRREGDATTISWDGIRASEFEIQRSPLPLDLSGLKVSGDLSGEITAVGPALRGLRLSGQLSGSAVPPSTGRFDVRARQDAQGRWTLSGAAVPALSIPVANLLRVFGLQEYVSSSGLLTLTDGTYDAATRSAAGLLRFENLLVEKAGVTLKQLNGEARASFKDGTFTVKGRIEPAQLFILHKHLEVPAMALTLTATLGPDGQWQEFAVNLGWENGDRIALSAVVSSAGKTGWRAMGRVETTFWGGLNGTYDVTVDTGGFESSGWERWKVGPLVLKLDNFDMGRLADTPLGAFVPAPLKLAGLLPKLNLEASPFFLGELRTGRPASTIVASGEFEKLSVRYNPSGSELERSEADRLSGTFRGEVAFDAGSAGFACNLLATLKDYEMLLDPRYVVFLRSFKPNERFYIPPPQPKEKLVAQFVGQIQPQKGGTMDVRVHKLLFDMDRRLRLSATGRMTVPADWDIFEKGEGYLSELEVSSTDLESLNRDLLRRNIGLRVPDLKLSGSFSYTGRHVWSADRSALSGELVFRNFNTAGTGWSLNALNGTLPIVFHQGLWPGDWPRERRGTLTVGGVDRAPLRVPTQPLAVIATPNILALANPVKAVVPGGEVQVENLRIQNILSGAPLLDFQFRVDKLDFPALAAEQKWVFNGLQGYGQQPPAVLTGVLNPCQLWRENGEWGRWQLETRGTLSAPLFEGTLSISGLYSQDCLGLTPVIGVREVKVEGLSVGSLTALNPIHGHVKVDVDAKLTDFEMRGVDVDGIRKFRLEVRSIPKPEKEYFFERRFAQWLSNEPEEAVSVGKKPLFQQIGWAMELAPVTAAERQQDGALKPNDAWLYYMLPLLPDECILTGVRLEGVENAAVSSEKRQVKGKKDERLLWSEVVKKWLKRETSEIRSQRSEVRGQP